MVLNEQRHLKKKKEETKLKCFKKKLKLGLREQ